MTFSHNSTFKKLFCQYFKIYFGQKSVTRADRSVLINSQPHHQNNVTSLWLSRYPNNITSTHDSNVLSVPWCLRSWPSSHIIMQNYQVLYGIYKHRGSVRPIKIAIAQLLALTTAASREIGKNKGDFWNFRIAKCYAPYFQLIQNSSLSLWRANPAIWLARDEIYTDHCRKSTQTLVARSSVRKQKFKSRVCYARKLSGGRLFILLYTMIYLCSIP